MADSALHRPHRGVSAAERKSIRRATLIESGLELFGTQGIAAVSIDQICVHARLNKRYFYESFSSLDDLVDAVVKRILADIAEGLVPRVAEGGFRNPQPAVAYFVDTVLSDHRIARLLFVEADSGALTNHSQRFIDGAVELWLASDPNSPDDPIPRGMLRMGAYAFGGACREVLLASITGKLDHSTEQITAYLVALLAAMSAGYDTA